MAREDLLLQLGDPISDAEEETFLLFSQQIPSQNLGFVDAHATTLDLSIRGRDFTISQSPTLLSSNRAAGTTGAVLWKITPLIAEWLSTPTNLLCTTSILAPHSTVLELGCGTSGLIGLTLAQHVRKYIATDQAYVLKILRDNIYANAEGRLRQKAPKTRRGHRHAGWGDMSQATEVIQTMPLDWELDDVSELSSIIGHDPNPNSTLTTQNKKSGLDLIIACDCIYNDALIPPFVRTCAELCHLKQIDSQTDSQAPPTVCLIAQQLRSAEVLESWLRETMNSFDVWRIPDGHLIPELRENSGFVAHLAVLKSS